VRPPPAGTRERREAICAATLLALGMIVLSLPVGLLSRVGGTVPGVGGVSVLPLPSFLIGTACLATATWAAIVALTHSQNGPPRDTAGARLGIAILGLIGAAEFGGAYRTVLQIADLHGFYLSGSQATTELRAPTVYWGLTVLTIATVAFVSPLVVAAANLLPHRHGPDRYRRTVLAVSQCRSCLLAPILGAVVIVGICAAMPPSLQANLGYSGPSLSGARVTFPITILDASIWQSFARLSFLTLLVGMWEGMESARACSSLARRKGVADWIALTVDYRILVGVAAGAACGIAWLNQSPFLIPAAITLSGIVVISSAGALRRAVAIPALGTVGSRLGFSEDWRSAAPIGRVLLVLAAPVALPLGVDLWHGIEGPFRLPADAESYVYFWREFGIDQVPSVTIAGIFGHGLDEIALYSAALIGLLLVGAFFNVVFLRDNVDGLGNVMWILVPITAIAVAFVPIIQIANRPSAALLIGAAGLPAFLLMDRSAQRDDAIKRLAIALALLGCWAYAVWNVVWLPPFTMLAAAIVWRFLFHPGGLNDLDCELRFRRVALLAALALLGLGMLVLHHGDHGDLLPSNEFADVTDRIAVAVVAPIWLLHYAVRAMRSDRYSTSVADI
jgi:hypothetical protein